MQLRSVQLAASNRNETAIYAALPIAGERLFLQHDQP